MKTYNLLMKGCIPTAVQTCKDGAIVAVYPLELDFLTMWQAEYSHVRRLSGQRIGDFRVLCEFADKQPTLLYKKKAVTYNLIKVA